ncbi:MAG: DUF1573 domain-containing protein [Candidatus Poribacteria bacterium]|nr:DUF1573 domain-containing protein [Candidatus Poribacteria bacterium]
MSYHFAFLMLALCSSISLLQGCSAHRAPKVVFPNTVYQFPEPFIVGSEITTTFTFTNEGNILLHIEKINADCGCVATNTSSDKIPPGGKGEIRVVVERDVGGFRQNVFVFTDDPATPIVRLEVSGVIVPPIAYPSKIDLRQLEKKKRVSKKITLTNNLKNAVEITGHTVSNKSIAVTLPQNSVPIGESIELEVVLSLEDVGLYSESLTLSAQTQEVLPGTDSKELEMSIQFQGRVLGGIVVLPQNLFLGVLNTSGESVQKKVQIKTDGSLPFTLKKVSAENFTVTADLTMESQRVHDIVLFIAPKVDDSSSGLIEGTIQIATDHPDIPEIAIPVKAVQP